MDILLLSHSDSATFPLIASIASFFVFDSRVHAHSIKRMNTIMRVCLYVLTLTTTGLSPVSSFCGPRRLHSRATTATRLLETSNAASQSSLETRAAQLMQTSNNLLSKVTIAPVTTHRLGFVATQRIPKGDVIVSLPCQSSDIDFPVLTVQAAQQVFQDVLPKDENFESWTGDAGLLAMLLLHYVAQDAAAVAGAAASAESSSSPASAVALSFRTAWIHALPTLDEMMHHPYFWSEADQEILQMSSTTKLYRKLDDMQDDFAWWNQHVLQKDRTRFPEYILSTTDNKNQQQQQHCFTWKGFQWAMAIVQSRSFFLDGSLRIIPLLDMCNHDDAAQEIQLSQPTGIGAFFGGGGGNKQPPNAVLIADRTYEMGQEVYCSYGPKSAADYLLEYGFGTDQCWKTAVAELVFELDAEDRFRNDKLDVLEFETYDQAPMDPVQTFDVVSRNSIGGSRMEDAPDPAMMQFLRLCHLGGTDAFLLESIFRKDVWGYMALPVSEQNELAVVNAIAEACQRALGEFNECSTDTGPLVCTQLREAETRALTQMMAFVKREKEALDLKEYYQERRLKDLGLDSEWSLEDEKSSMEGDLSFGQTRAPGGADYDW